MPGDSLREFRFVLKDTRGETPTTGWVKVAPTDYTHDTGGRGRELIKLLRQTSNRNSHNLRKGEFDSFQLTSALFYDWLLYLWSLAFGLPTTGNHSGATGVKDHTLADSESYLWADIRFLDSEGWWEMTNCVVDHIGVQQETETYPTQVFDLKGDPARPLTVKTLTIGGSPTSGSFTVTVPALGKYGEQTTATVAHDASAATLQAALEALTRVGSGGVIVTKSGQVFTALFRPHVGPIGTITAADTFDTGDVTIATPTFDATFPLSETLAAYDHPADWLHFLGKINGSSAYVRSFSVDINFNRTPRYTGRRTTSPSAWQKPDIEITGTILEDYQLATDVASLFQMFRNDQLEPSLTFEYLSEADLIGTGTPTNPLFSLLLQKVGLTSAEHDVQAMPTDTPIQFTALYDTGDGESLIATFTNEIASVTAQ